MSRLLLALLVALVALPASAQDVWSDAATSRVAPRADLREYRVVRLDGAALQAALAPAARLSIPATVPFPLPDGGTVAVPLTEASVMEGPLQARYPEIRTYRAQGAAASGRVAVTPNGVTALLFTPAGTVVVDPVEAGSDLYVVYRQSDLIVPEDLLAALADDDLGTAAAPAGLLARRAGSLIGQQLKTYRFAVAARAEYTQRQGAGAARGTVAAGLAAVASAVNRANALFERDMAVTFKLVANNDRIIYTDPDTDPYEDGEARNPFTNVADSPKIIYQNQQAIDREIGPENYDLGHLIAFNVGGGLAYLRGACNTGGIRAQAYSGVGNETSLFDLVVFPHEIGHQLGAPHTWVRFRPNVTPNQAGVEPGPGYSIMAYGQFSSRPSAEQIGFFFHGASIGFMENFVRAGGGVGCGTETATGNQPPVVTVPVATYTIPPGTPFRLQGSATDDSGTALTYSWEQNDFYLDGSGARPIYRVFDPGPSPVRSFPDFARVLSGPPYPEEGLLEPGEIYTFQLVVRDNASGGGGVEGATVEVATRDGGPFRVTSQAQPLTYNPGSEIVVTWDPAGTGGSTPTVDVLFSPTNGNGGLGAGQAFEVVVAATANDGEARFTLPAGDVPAGRVMVRAVGNVFYNVSAAPFKTGQAPVAELSRDEIDVQIEPNQTRNETIQVANLGPVALDYSVSVENVVFPDGSGGGSYGAIKPGAAGGPTVGFQDIAATGTELSFFNFDDGTAEVSLPFAFPFFGVDYSSATVSVNGLIGFGPFSSTAAENAPIPSAGAPNGIIAALWDDLTTNQKGFIYSGTLADGRFVVQWSGVGQVGNPDAAVTFQILLSPDGTSEVQYGTLSGNLASATVGIEGPNGLDGTQVVFNGSYLRSNQAVRFVPRRQYIRVAGGSGTLAPGETADVTVSLDATDIADGTALSADVVVRTNDPTALAVRVPVRVQVGGGVANEDGPDGVEVSLVAPNPTRDRAGLRVTLATPGALRATVHDALGRQVAVLFDGPASGDVDLSVDAGQLAAGVYIVRVVGDGFVEARRMVVTR